MRELYYDVTKQAWYQTETPDEKLLLGKFFSVPYRAKPDQAKNHLSFSFQINENKAGPVVGILASPQNEGFTGNIALFKRIQRMMMKHGGLSIVFTPNLITEEGLSGFCFLPKYDQWIRITAPLPDIIYNRLSNHSDEKEFLEQTRNLTALYQIPVFNPQFFDKWELYLQLRDHEKLAPHLPKTALLSIEELEDYLASYPAVYIKKRQSHKGKGIYLIIRNGHTFLMRTTSTSTFLFPSISKLARFLQKEDPLHAYIIQEAIPTIRMAGKKFDYRVLAHPNNNRFVLTGIGVRMAKKQQVTTHVPKGGVVVSVEDLPIKTDHAILKTIVECCGRQLVDFYDDVGEFSADIGVTQEGKYYIFELNAKPMDFDEPEIKQQAAENLVKVFYERTNYSLEESLH
jgi:hypothetical protein